jgi:hypothetical protein
MPIAKYEGLKLDNKVFRLEECWFINCVLSNCVIFYSGGSFDFQNTTFQNCQWKFQGEAASTFQLLHLIGLIPSGQTPPPEIQASGGPVN